MYPKRGDTSYLFALEYFQVLVFECESTKILCLIQYCKGSLTRGLALL